MAKISQKLCSKSMRNCCVKLRCKIWLTNYEFEFGATTHLCPWTKKEQLNNPSFQGYPRRLLILPALGRCSFSTLLGYRMAQTQCIWQKTQPKNGWRVLVVVKLGSPNVPLQDKSTEDWRWEVRYKNAFSAQCNAVQPMTLCGELGYCYYVFFSISEGPPHLMTAKSLTPSAATNEYEHQLNCPTPSIGLTVWQ